MSTRPLTAMAPWPRPERGPMMVAEGPLVRGIHRHLRWSWLPRSDMYPGEETLAGVPGGNTASAWGSKVLVGCS
jgi:hypothetical protein